MHAFTIACICPAHEKGWPWCPATGFGTLPTGLGTLPTGVGVLPTGLGTLPTGLGVLPTGLGTLPTGLGVLPTGLGTLPTGLGVLPTGLGTLPTGLGVLPTGLGTLPTGLGVLPTGLGVLPTGLGVLPTGLGVPEMLLKPKAKIKIYPVRYIRSDRLLSFAQLGANWYTDLDPILLWLPCDVLLEHLPDVSLRLQLISPHLEQLLLGSRRL